MVELMFQCSLFLVFLIGSLFGKSYWLRICCRDLILQVNLKEEQGFIWVWRIHLDVGSTSILAVVHLSEVMAVELPAPWVLSFVCVVRKKPCKTLHLFPRKLRSRMTENKQSQWELNKMLKISDLLGVWVNYHLQIRFYLFSEQTISLLVNPAVLSRIQWIFTGKWQP